jgi:hypothetical protein
MKEEERGDWPLRKGSDGKGREGRNEKNEIKKPPSLPLLQEDECSEREGRR